MNKPGSAWLPDVAHATTHIELTDGTTFTVEHEAGEDRKVIAGIEINRDVVEKPVDGPFREFEEGPTSSTVKISGPLKNYSRGRKPVDNVPPLDRLASALRGTFTRDELDNILDQLRDDSDELGRLYDALHLAANGALPA